MFKTNSSEEFKIDTKRKIIFRGKNPDGSLEGEKESCINNAGKQNFSLSYPAAGESKKHTWRLLVLTVNPLPKID